MVAIAVFIVELMIFYSLNLFGEAYRSEEFCTAMVAVFSVAYIYSIENSRTYQKFSRELLLGYFWRIFLLFWDLYAKSIYALPNSGADSSKFFREASNYVLKGDTNMGSFPLFMGKIFKLIGISHTYGQFLVMLTSIVAIHMFVLILDRLDISFQVKKNSLLIVCLLPNFAILSSIFLRETPVTMLITISVYFFVLWFQGGNYVLLILAFLADLAGCYFHSGSIGVAIGYIIVLLVYNKRTSRYQLSFFNILFAIVLTFALGYLYMNYSNLLFSKIGGVDSIEDIANTYNSGGSSYARYVGDSSTISNMLIYTPLRVVYFLFSPFPWQWRGLADIIAFCFSSMFYIYASFNTIKNMPLYSPQNRRLVIAMFILIACIVFIFAWGVSNTGTATRHREKLVILFATLWAASQNRASRETYRNYN